MVPKDLDEKLLRYMYRDHVEKHGHGVRNLADSKIILTAGAGSIERAIPEILVEKNGMKKYLVVPAAQELMAKGYVQFSADNCYFWLTERGYARGGLGFIGRGLVFFNDNPGLSIPIALLALVVSIFALFRGGS